MIGRCRGRQGRAEGGRAVRALDQSDELLQRGAELRARSLRIHAAQGGCQTRQAGDGPDNR